MESKGINRFFLVRLVYYLLAFACSAVFAKALSTIALGFLPPMTHNALALLRNGLLLALVFASYAVLVRYLERRPAREINLATAAPQFAIGIVLGVLLIALLFGALWALNVAHFELGTAHIDVVKAIAYPTIIGLLEELLFRVILFGIFEEILGSALAVILSAVLFGLAHLVNPGADAFDIFVLAAGVGVLLALCYALTRNIGLSAGVHMGWNFAIASIFGASVSGLERSPAILTTTLVGPDSLTGGAFGIEGSLPALAICIAASAIVLILTARRHTWKRRAWRFSEAPH